MQGRSLAGLVRTSADSTGLEMWGPRLQWIRMPEARAVDPGWGMTFGIGKYPERGDSWPFRVDVFKNSRVYPSQLPL